MLALQESFDVSRDELPLHRGGFAFHVLLGGRNPVSAGMFGHVHSGVGDADNVLDGEPVHREAGHAEAAADVVLGQHRVGRDPQTQALGQNLGLLHAGFRHEDDELVAAVARYHVRLPALLLK